jgi:O-antigen/teichoic acid export membrane protein
MSASILLLIKQSSVYGGGNIILRFISLFLLPFFTKYLTPSDYGIISVLFLASLIFQIIFGLGLSSSMGVIYFQKKNLKYKSKVVINTFFVTILSCLVLITLGLLFLNQIRAIIDIPYQYSHLIC